MNTIDQGKYVEGRAAYRSGVYLLDVIQHSFNAHEAAAQPGADWQAIETADKSYLLGFAEGLLEDIRTISGTARRGGLRA